MVSMSESNEDLGEEAEYFDEGGKCYQCRKDYEHCKCWGEIGRQHNSRHRGRTGHWFPDHDPWSCEVCIGERQAVTEEAKARLGVEEDE